MKRIVCPAIAFALMLHARAQNFQSSTAFADAEKQTSVMLKEIPTAKMNRTDLISPRTLDSGRLKLVTSRDWTSGFFPGQLWLLYEYTGKKEWKEQAEHFTSLMEREKTNGGTHDMGFKIYCSFGNGYRITKNPAYKQVIIESAKTLSTRFRPVTGVIRSWDHNRDKWGYPVIIDNMMNLELLFAATQLTGDSGFHKIAVSHANTTLKNHFRPDNSSYHVVDYDTVTGNVVKKQTHQGFAHESAWSRGQAWGLYGFTMCYRFTGDRKYLEQAEKIATFMLNHENMPQDLVPYWDYNAPRIPNEERDVSAAAILASGLYELSTFSRQGKLYKLKADKIMESLTQKYRSPVGKNKGFILLHSTGSKPAKSEVDQPLSYADYYYLEALLRSKKQRENDARLAWWREARFGMFIHWGVYAVPAGVYNGQRINRIGEWIMNRGKIPVEGYKKYAADFNPVKYDPEGWVLMAKNAGMKYIVITSKHHDGFALFDSKVTNWDIADATPYKKDLLKPLAVACRKYGIKLGFYYSHAQDWVHPGGAAIRRVATEGWENPDSAAIDAYTKAHGGHWDPAQTTKTMAQYIDEIAVPQVKEILTNYGDVAVLWWDTPTDMTDEFAEKLDTLLKLQPNIITNDRLKRPNYPGDFKTPEQRIPNLSELDGKDWETCMTMNETWGYKSWAHEWKSKETLIRNLIDIASKGGNFLLNVGPMADGTIPQESIDGLKQIGEWMKVNGESIYKTQQSPFGTFTWGRCTRKETAGKTVLYLSVFEWPKDGRLMIPQLKTEIISAKLLANGKAVKAQTTNQGAVISVPEKAPDPVATVIKIELRGNLLPDLAKQ